MTRDDITKIGYEGAALLAAVPKDQFPSERVYRPTPDAELRLITCGGDFDPGRLSYRDNIVVYAVID
jgi:hypothetical protein